MRVIRYAERGPLKTEHCNFVIYDETKVFDEDGAIAKRLREKFSGLPDFERIFPDALKTAIEYSKHGDGRAYGHPRLCEFTVYRDKATQFGFDNEIRYSAADLKKIISLAAAAKRRIQWAPEEQS